MKELLMYYSLAQTPLIGKIALAFNLFIFFMNTRRMHVAAATLILLATLSCTLTMMYRHRQESIRDVVFIKRVILPAFLGMTVSIILFSYIGADLAIMPYNISHNEAMGIFFESRGIFFIIMSNLNLILMVLKEAMPEEKRKKYQVILFVPLLLLAIL